VTKKKATTITRKVAGRRYSVNVPEDRDPETGESLVSAQDLKRAELAIAAAIALDGPPSGDAFSMMRRVLGLSAERLATLLDVKARTISRWETGATAVNRTAWVAVGDLVLEAAGKPIDARGRLERIADGTDMPRDRLVELN
jgi:DNA-binding transcriptional regulator YiaG